jgi:hypothetical protein
LLVVMGLPPAITAIEKEVIVGPAGTFCEVGVFVTVATISASESEKSDLETHSLP